MGLNGSLSIARVIEIVPRMSPSLKPSFHILKCRRALLIDDGKPGVAFCKKVAVTLEPLASEVLFNDVM
jgi:hypothetical protein